MTGLRGWTALVTGAGGGLGGAISRELAGNGVNLILSDRAGSDLDDLVRDVRAEGVQAWTVVADLMDREERLSLVSRSEQVAGPIDLLVNNAGVEYMLPSYTLRTSDEIEVSATVNLLAVMQLTHAVLPGMLSRRRGAVVTISSVAGKMALPFDPTYAATKYGVAAFMRSLATEQGSSPVTFSTIFPGAIRSAGMGTGLSATFPAWLLPFATRSPEDVARAVVKAASRGSAEVIVSAQPTFVPALLNAVAPRLWISSGHLLVGRGRRVLAAVGRTDEPADGLS